MSSDCPLDPQYDWYEVSDWPDALPDSFDLIDATRLDDSRM